MSFFKQFPSVIYDLDKKGHKVQVKDIFRFVDVNEKLIDGASAYQYYYIKDGERPDHVAAKLYKNTEFYWTFFVVNDFLKQGYDTWPLSYQQLQTQIKTDYQPYSILEIDGHDNTKISSNNTSPRSLYFGFYDLPHGQGKPSRLSPNNWSPAIADGKVFKYDEQKNQLWIENQSQRLKNHVAKSGHGPLKMQAFTSDSKMDTRLYNFKRGYQYAWQAPNYFKDSNEEEVAFYDASDEGGDRVTATFPNYTSPSSAGTYVRKTISGQTRWTHEKEFSYGTGLTQVGNRYIFFNSPSNRWSYSSNDEIVATLAPSPTNTESAGWWNASPNAWAGTGTSFRLSGIASPYADYNGLYEVKSHIYTSQENNGVKEYHQTTADLPSSIGGGSVLIEENSAGTEDDNSIVAYHWGIVPRGTTSAFTNSVIVERNSSSPSTRRPWESSWPGSITAEEAPSFIGRANFGLTPLLAGASYQFLTGTGVGSTLVTNREQIEDENEKRTKIRVVKPQHIAEFAELYKRLVRL